MRWKKILISGYFLSELCSASHLNCSGPSQPQLLQALTPIFNLSAIRPVMNMTTSTNVSIYFILYGVLGVVSPPNLESDDFTFFLITFKAQIFTKLLL